MSVVVEGISRSFGRGAGMVQALHDVSFEIRTGEVLALLGSNGAGKTTMSKILSTLLLPTSGTARICGHDVVADAAAVRLLTSVIFGGERGLYTRLSGRENVRFFAMLAGVGRRAIRDRLAHTLAQVGLADVADRRVETYSKGMRQRLHIAIGLISRPQILLLDEPTVGLDPLEAERLRNAISDMRDDGVTVLLTSHNLPDVERLASQVVLLDRGRVSVNLPLAKFVAQAGYAAVVEIRSRQSPDNVGLGLPQGVTLDSWMFADGACHVTLRLREWTPDSFRDLAMVLDSLEVLDMQVRPASLEEAYAKLANAR